MARWIREQVKPQRWEQDTYASIYCFTCKHAVFGKDAIKPKHKGHEVEYVDVNGEILS